MSISKAFVTCILLLFFVNNVLAQLASNTFWLDALDLSAASQGYGMPGNNRSVDGKKITIGGVSFERGFGTHAVSSLIVDLKGSATSFSAFVGMDDEITGHQAAAEFVLIADGKNIWSSGVMHVGDQAKRCQASVIGVQKLVLVVNDGDNGNYYDHADWADAKFETNGKNKPETYNPISSTPYILTPISSPSPRINSASVFGVRPSSPFQFMVSTSGQRPITFSAKGLPNGLKIDPLTGIITGVIDKEGTFVVSLTATNSKGTAQKKMRIISGAQIALTPVMGWNSWNCFADQVSADKVKRAAKSMVESGLINHGWTYINVDDFWQNNRESRDIALKGPFRDSLGNIIPNTKFGDMKNLAEHIHSLGLKVGLYSSPGPWTCGGCAGSYGYEKQDAESYAKWGFDYLKYDWCSYGGVINGLPDDDPAKVPSLSYNGGNELAIAKKPFQLMGDFLKAQPRDIVFSLCQYGMSDVWKWGEAVGGSSWRTTNDTTDTWTSVKNIALMQDKSAPWSGPGKWNGRYACGGNSRMGQSSPK